MSGSGPPSDSVPPTESSGAQELIGQFFVAGSGAGTADPLAEFQIMWNSN